MKPTACAAVPVAIPGMPETQFHPYMKAFRYLWIPFLTLVPGVINVSAEWDEATALAVLDSDTEKKARACQVLAVVGGPEAVPALAELLHDKQLASYARTALEVIEDPSAGEALRAALPNLDGRMLAGVVTSIGVRGDEAAVPALRELAANSQSEVANSALAALARIGSEEALATVVQALNQGPADLRVSAAHAALAAAEKLAKAGNDQAAQRLLEAVQAAVLPEHIRRAATTLSSN